GPAESDAALPRRPGGAGLLRARRVAGERHLHRAPRHPHAEGRRDRSLAPAEGGPGVAETAGHHAHDHGRPARGGAMSPARLQRLHPKAGRLRQVRGGDSADRALRAAAARAASRRCVKRPASPSARSPSILVVDDDEGLLILMADSLRAEGYTVATAESAAVARVALRQHAPDLMLLDLKLKDGE